MEEKILKLKKRGGRRDSFLFETIEYNLGQRIRDKFPNLSKIDFSMECFTADFSQFFTKKRQNLAFAWAAGYSP